MKGGALAERAFAVRCAVDCLWCRAQVRSTCRRAPACVPARWASGASRVCLPSAIAYLAQAAALGVVFAQLFDLGAADRISSRVRRRLHGRGAGSRAGLQVSTEALRALRSAPGRELPHSDEQYSYYAQPLTGLLSRPPAGAQVAGTTWSRGQSSSSFACIRFPATSGGSLSIFDIAAVTWSFWPGAIKTCIQRIFWLTRRRPWTDRVVRVHARTLTFIEYGGGPRRVGVSVAGDGSRFRPIVSRVDARQDAHGRQGCQVTSRNLEHHNCGDYHAPV